MAVEVTYERLSSCAAGVQVCGVVPFAPHLRGHAVSHRYLQPGPPADGSQVAPFTFSLQWHEKTADI